jgi:hypothetical protein
MMDASREASDSGLSSSGFWSYAHGDNELDDGAILKLADLLAQEYDLLSGAPLNLFVDRNDLAWGDEWKVRVDQALTRTTFFIPVITPRYFTRPECRRELLEYSAKARALGANELILPILYVKPPGFSPDSADEAVSLVARMQYEDWTNTRLDEPTSRKYRASVNALANRLIEVASRMSEAQLSREVSNEDAGRGLREPEGVGDLMAEVASLLPDWLDAVLGDRVVGAQFDATWHATYGPVNKLIRSNAPASAVFAAQMRVGKEMLPLFERALADAQTYLSRSIELDVLVSRLVLLVSSHRSEFPLLEPLVAAIHEAIVNIQAHPPRELSDSDHTVRDHIIELKSRARLFQKLDDMMLEMGRLADEGNAIVERWHSELGALQRPEQVESMGSARPHVSREDASQHTHDG